MRRDREGEREREREVEKNGEAIGDSRIERDNMFLPT